MRVIDISSRLTILSLLLALAAFAQSIGTDGNIVPDNPEKFLRTHHVVITEEGLVAALRSPNTGVRNAAAGVLADRWPARALPTLEQAIKDEKDEFTRVTIAFRLAKIGGQAGRDALRSECHSDGNWGSTKMFAAKSLIELDDYSCVDSLLKILKTTSDPQDTYAKEETIELVPRLLGHLGEFKPQQIYELLETALEDPAVGVRMDAARILGQLGVVHAIPKLQAAIAKEQEPGIKDIMKTELSRLQQIK